MMADLLFYAMLAFLFSHELDAVGRHEWRMLPLLNKLSDERGAKVFIWLHVPLFMAIFYFIATGSNARFELLLSGFSVVHVGLHWLYRNHPDNEFNNPGSVALILGAGLLGAMHILASYL